MNQQDKSRAAFEAWKARDGNWCYVELDEDAFNVWQAAIAHAETQMNKAGSDSEIDLPPLPDPEIDDAGAFMSDAQVMTIESAKEYARVAVEHDRKQRGEPVVWPKNAQEIRDFIGVHFMTMVGEDTPSDDDKYLVTAHDLLSAFLWWTDFAPQPAEPSSEHTGTVKCPDPSMGAHACNDKSQCWEPCGELGKSAEHAKVAEPEKVPSDAELYALIQEWFAPSYIPGENLYVLRFARALLARYGNATPTQENES